MLNRMYKISVILPIFNAEKYLYESISSLLNQTFSEVEIICVNDCSTDNSIKILNEFSAMDSRIKILNNTNNSGAGYSRNKGIEVAEGEYVLVLDADDIFDERLIELTYNECKEKNLDVVLFDYYKYDNQTSAVIECSMPISFASKIFSKVANQEDIGEYSFQLCLAAPWVKMYRRQFLMDNNILFQNLKSSNDAYFGRMVMLTAERIGYLNKTLIKYRVNNELQTSNNNQDGPVNLAKALIAIHNEMCRTDIYIKNRKSFNTYSLQVMLASFQKTRDEYKEEMHAILISTLEELFKNIDISNSFLNQCYAMQYKDIMRMTYNEMMKSNVFDIYNYIFEYDKKKVDDLFCYIKNNEYRYVLWGYGKNGKAFYHNANAMGYKADYIIDSNKSLDNDPNITFASVNRLKKKKCAIIVTTAIYAKSILNFIRDELENSVVFDAEAYFIYGVPLEECFYC
jgi:glycosyltransferase involved in cell wall biosynthesis